MKTITIRKYRACVGQAWYEGHGASLWQGSTRAVHFMRGNEILCTRMVACGGDIPLSVPELRGMKVGEELPRHLVQIVGGDHLRMWVGGSYYTIK